VIKPSFPPTAWAFLLACVSTADTAGPVDPVARSDDALQTFAFLLDQDLSDTDFEFAVDREWRTRMISVRDLEQLVGAATFPLQLHESDQIDASGGEAIRAETGIETITG
jgi:hypothetical protein